MSFVQALARSGQQPRLLSCPQAAAPFEGSTRWRHLQVDDKPPEFKWRATAGRKGLDERRSAGREGTSCPSFCRTMVGRCCLSCTTCAGRIARCRFSRLSSRAIGNQGSEDPVVEFSGDHMMTSGHMPGRHGERTSLSICLVRTIAMRSSRGGQRWLGSYTFMRHGAIPPRRQQPRCSARALTEFTKCLAVEIKKQAPLCSMVAAPSLC